MNHEEYLKERVDNQINWFNKKSSTNKNWYYGLGVFEIFLAISISFINITGLIEESSKSLISSIIGGLIAAIAGLLTFVKFQQNWFRYRITSESLISEKYKFITMSEPYSAEDAYNQFVNNIELILTRENKKWAESDNNDN